MEQRDTICLYDGWNVVAELDANASNAKLRTYVWGSDLSGTMEGAGGVGGLLWVNNLQTSYDGQTLPTGVHFVAYDGNGNVLALVKAGDGSLSARYEYGPFGEPVRVSGALADAQPFRFSTKWTDAESGLLYYGYRYYYPITGRWLSRDPIQENGGENLYGYVNNSPIAQWDTLGHFPNPFERQKPPPNNIDPPPSGPFSQCKIALVCGLAVSGQDHCGLVVDTGNGVYAIHGSGGTINSRWVTPASSSDATGPWTNNPTTVCECIFASIAPWNERNYSRDQTGNNSNWNLKCLNKKCGVGLNWGSQKQPLGYDGKYCARWTTVFYGPPIGSCRVCARLVDCPEDA